MFEAAEKAGSDAVQNAFENCFEEAKNDYRQLTDLSLFLDSKIDEHKDVNTDLEKVYAMAWAEVDSYSCDNLKGAELKYYLRSTD
jgi:hypothetical protein